MKKSESLKNMVFRLQNIAQILCIFYFTKLFSVQATTLSTLPNEVKSTSIFSSDAENATSAPNKPEVTSILATETINTTVLEHNASTNWSTAATISTSTNATRLSSLTTLSHFTRNSTNNTYITTSDATERFSTEDTPSTTLDHTLNVSTTQGIHADVNVSTVETVTSANEYPPTQSDISHVTELITKNFDVMPTSQMSGNEIRLNNSEVILTIAFSIILGIVVVMLIIYSLNKYRKRRSQYSHHPLHDTSYESADRYSVPDDTLVISGGLYDAPRVYNPNMTVLEDEDCQHDYLSFGSRPGQFRLEFLPGEKEREPTYGSSAFETFHSLQKNS